MPRNIEIKVALGGLDAARTTVTALGARYVATEEQVDRYFEVDVRRRVKLRTFGNGTAELIEYTRPETDSARVSNYEIKPVRDEHARACLVPKGPPQMVVRKQREIYLIDNVRVHLDTVDGLGTFLELEAVVDVAHDEAVCRAQTQTLMQALGVRPTDCLRASYADLLRQRDAP